MPFDLITSPTTSVGDAREPVFVHPEQEAAGLARLDDYVATHGRRPNILVILMDDVGWGDFGCYGGGVALGAPTPNIDRLAAGGLRLTSCYSEPSCTPSRASLMTGRLPSRHGLQRPPMYGEPGGLHDEVTVAELLSAAGYVTQCVGKWHIGENRESQPQHVGFDDFYGFLSVSDMYSEWRDPHYFPEIVYGEARSEWVRNLAFNKCFVHAERGGDVEEVEEVDIPCLSRLDDTWCRYSEEFIARMGQGDAPWFLYHNTRGAHFDNYPSERWLGASAAKHPYGDTIMELDDIVGRLVAALEDSGQLEHTIIVLSSDNGPHMENWPDAGYTPFRCAKGSTWEGGVRVPGIVSWPGMIEPGQVSDGLLLVHRPAADGPAPGRRARGGARPTASSTASTRRRSCSPPAGPPTASSSTTGCWPTSPPSGPASTSSRCARRATTSATPPGPAGSPAWTSTTRIPACTTCTSTRRRSTATSPASWPTSTCSGPPSATTCMTHVAHAEPDAAGPG